MTDWLTPKERNPYPIPSDVRVLIAHCRAMFKHAAEADRRIEALEAERDERNDDLRFALEQLMYRDECQEHARIALMQEREGLL